MQVLSLYITLSHVRLDDRNNSSILFGRENCLHIPREIISSSFYDHYSCMIISILSTSELISFSVVILCSHGVISVIFWNAINADTLVSIVT